MTATLGVVTIDGRPARPAGCPICGRNAAAVLWRRHGYDWLRCDRDGMVWVSPQLTAEAVAAIYDAGHSLKERSLGGGDRPVPERYRRIVSRLTTDAGQPGRLLEIGAFDGLFLQAALQAGWQVEGTEIDAVAAAAARRRGAAMHVGPLETAPFAPASFDAVVLRDVLEHLPSPRLQLDRIAAWLRTGGVLYVWTPNFDGLARRFHGQGWGAVIFPWHFSYFTATTLKNLLAMTGFRVRRLHSRNLLLGRRDPYLLLERPESVPGASKPRLERLLARCANPLFGLLDRVGCHVGAQLEAYACRE